ncbi:hypothetical protein [Kiloniella sp. b19]|uniref:hypothetical protein n=1 Tax=Kiloniella sp. GXU_MW_B19 TaxID=3141326 RepID=UPI0031D6AA35
MALNSFVTSGLGAALLLVSGCAATATSAEFTADGDSLIFTGEIDGNTLGSLKRALRDNPGVTQIHLLEVPGSVDDEASLTALADFIRRRDLITVVPSDGLVASGGTDMALMGTTRIIEDGACIGVHSWAVPTLLGYESGADVPDSSPDHDLYLDFYESVDIPEDFYWFTLEAAGPEEIHWMSPEEINFFGLSVIPLDESLHETDRQRARRCDNRVW